MKQGDSSQLCARGARPANWLYPDFGFIGDANRIIAPMCVAPVAPRVCNNPCAQLHAAAARAQGLVPRQALRSQGACVRACHRGRCCVTRRVQSCAMTWQDYDSFLNADQAGACGCSASAAADAASSYLIQHRPPCSHRELRHRANVHRLRLPVPARLPAPRGARVLQAFWFHPAAAPEPIPPGQGALASLPCSCCSFCPPPPSPPPLPSPPAPPPSPL